MLNISNTTLNFLPRQRQQLTHQIRTYKYVIISSWRARILPYDICQVTLGSSESLLWVGVVTQIYIFRFMFLLQTILGWSTFKHIADCNRGISIGKVGIITSTGNGNAKPVAGHSSHRNCVILPCGAIALQRQNKKKQGIEKVL